MKATGVLPGRFERRPPAPVLRGLDFSIGAPDMAPPTTGDHPRIDRLDGALWLSRRRRGFVSRPSPSAGGDRNAAQSAPMRPFASTRRSCRPHRMLANSSMAAMMRSSNSRSAATRMWRRTGRRAEKSPHKRAASGIDEPASPCSPAVVLERASQSRDSRLARNSMSSSRPIRTAEGLSRQSTACSPMPDGRELARDAPAPPRSRWPWLRPGRSFRDPAKAVRVDRCAS